MNIISELDNILESLKIEAYNGEFYWRARDIQFLLDDCTWKKLYKKIKWIERNCQKNKLDTSKHIIRTKTTINDGAGEFLVDDFYLSNIIANQLFDEFNNNGKTTISHNTYYSKKRKKANKKQKKPSIGLYISSFLLSIFVMSIVIVLSIFYIPLKPLQYFRDLYIATAMTTHTHQWLATTFFPQETIDEVMGNVPEDFTENTLTKPSIYIPEAKTEIEVFDVSGSTYVGKLLKINNPEKVKIAISKDFGKIGQFLEGIVEDNNAIAGINGSGFVDYDGKGKAAYPVGILIKDSEILFDPGYSKYDVVGFDTANNLVVGTYTKEELLALNLRDAVEPFYKLTVNGNDRIKSGNGGYGLHPRTAIGQTNSGAVLMLVIEGRQLHSVGATMKDCQDILRSYGAINSAALDGGSSSIMYYKGSIQTKPSNGTTYGRYLPSAFVVYE